MLLVAAVPAVPAPQELSPLAQEILASHNQYRARLGLRPLKWSAKLAAVAQKWADTLIQRHQFQHQRAGFGEFFEMHGGSASPDDVVHDWAAESLDYDYRSNRCSSVCGHYTQMIWHTTSEVGCAVSRGGGREVWVCEYNPPGNIAGQRPY